MTNAEAQARYRARHPDRAAASKALSRKCVYPTHYAHGPAYVAEQERIAALPEWVNEAVENLLGARRRVVAKATAARWRERNPDTVAKHNFFHNSKRRGVESSDSMLTWAEWQDILAEFNGACAYCLRTDRPLTVDHMDPLSKGGAHMRENAIPACKPCNSKKHDRSIFVMLRSA